MSQGPTVHFKLLHTASCKLMCVSRTFCRTSLSAIPRDKDSEIDASFVDLNEDEVRRDREIRTNPRWQLLTAQSSQSGVGPWVAGIALIG